MVNWLWQGEYFFYLELLTFKSFNCNKIHLIFHITCSMSSSQLQNFNISTERNSHNLEQLLALQFPLTTQIKSTTRSKSSSLSPHSSKSTRVKTPRCPSSRRSVTASRSCETQSPPRTLPQLCLHLHRLNSLNFNAFPTTLPSSRQPMSHNGSRSMRSARSGSSQSATRVLVSPGRRQRRSPISSMAVDQSST